MATDPDSNFGMFRAAFTSRYQSVLHVLDFATLYNALSPTELFELF